MSPDKKSEKCLIGLTQRLGNPTCLTLDQGRANFPLQLMALDYGPRTLMQPSFLKFRSLSSRRSEFLGCVSFPLKDATKADITGTYFLQSSGRPAHEKARVSDRCVSFPLKDATKADITGTYFLQSSGRPAHEKARVSDRNNAAAIAAALQREADEHLLVRGTGGGFGFTVVWTRPPRVERVAQGGSAERAGLRAGDYIVFVGNKNVVTVSEEEVRSLVKRISGNGAPSGVPSVRPRLSQVTISSIPQESTPPPAPRSPRGAALASPAAVARPPTACSSTSQSLDRRKLHLPQVTFSKETPGLATDGRRRALLAVVAREQHYTTCLQFGLVRFVSPLAERADLIAPSDHQLLFQNIEEIFRLSEEILEQIVQEDVEIQTSTVIAVAYQDVTAGSGLMGLAGDGKPLLSVSDLESRLVFTRCKLSRVEGRAVRPYWALLFSDLLLFATVSRDRVLFVTEEPVALGTISEAQFNVRKKATEFRLILGRNGGESPLVSCSPRTPGRTRTVALRAPSMDLKAVWQSLLQRQIYRAHTMSGTPLCSPLDSPDPQLTFSLATLDSQQRQVSASSIPRHSSLALLPASSYRSHLNMLVEERPEKEVRVSFDMRTSSASSIPHPVRGPLSTVWRTAPTPDTPSANLSPAGSQTFSSHFVSSSSIEKNDERPTSPSALLTPDGGEQYSETSPCRWESFEADLALADLDVDPSYKHAVEERIFLPADDPLMPRVALPERPTPPAYLEL
ncbi:Uncharacterized protein OBRU01_04775, partial [Operophtera brumata]